MMMVLFAEHFLAGIHIVKDLRKALVLIQVIA